MWFPAAPTIHLELNLVADRVVWRFCDWIREKRFPVHTGFTAEGAFRFDQGEAGSAGDNSLSDPLKRFYDVDSY